jgi:hypothetical protein
VSVSCECNDLTIRGAKFGKSRLVPLHGSSRDILAEVKSSRLYVN